MSLIDRRRFVGTLAVLPAGASLAPHATRARLDALFMSRTDRDLLVALASAVLPSRLGTHGWTRAVEGFERWVAAFRPGAELNHGYGTDELRQAGPDPWPRWQQRLRELDAEASRRFGSAFQLSSAEQRRELVAEALSASDVQRLPQAHEADHVALALLAWFHASSEANDLCYDARIGSESCRPLGEVANEPKPL